jgi:intein/homing endonuclease
MLQAKLDDADKALAIILQDPILFAEFMRNTKDGEKNTDLWPKKPFKYRWYQKDLMSDKSDAIILTGGRAIGKCMLGSNRAYTSLGYKRHDQLVNQRFMVWCLDNKNNLVLRRGICEKVSNTTRLVYRITTKSKYLIDASPYHPVLTPGGYVLAEDLKEGDLVAVTTKLPHPIAPTHGIATMRLLGYFLYQDMRTLDHTIDAQINYQFKTPIIRKDILACCKELGIKVDYLIDEDSISFKGNRVKKDNTILKLFSYFGMMFVQRYGWYRMKREQKITKHIMELGEEDTKAFLEALLAQYADISAHEIKLYAPNISVAKQLQELFLRFGIEMLIQEREDTKDFKKKYGDEKIWHVDLISRDKRAVYRALKYFDLPGYSIKNIQLPPESYDVAEHYRYEEITRIEKAHGFHFAIQVHQYENYIAENIYVHNSLILEDKMLFDIVNNDVQLEETPEILLTTANQNQMTPILDRLVMRFHASPLLKPLISGGLNRQKGTMDFKIGGRDVRLHARLAGLRGESNIVGLHIPRAIIDESQLYPINTFKQLVPAINQWQNNTQIFAAGVSNGVTNSTLTYLDTRNARFKKYRIPATCNPYFTYNDYIQAIKDYGGEDSDLFLQLVLGKHGKSAEITLSRDDIQTEAFDFYNFAYRNRDKVNRNASYIDKFKLPVFTEYEFFIAGIDCGYVDPTIIQVFGYRNEKWYLVARYLMQRIEFPEQEEVIHWLHKHYNFRKIAIDMGAGGRN